MEIDKKMVSVFTLCFVAAVLYMYREVNVIKLHTKAENETIMKKIKGYDEFQSNFDSTFETKLKSMMIRSDDSNE